MRFTIVTLAFLFFSTVVATPIFRTDAEDSVSLTRRSHTVGSNPRKRQGSPGGSGPRTTSKSAARSGSTGGTTARNPHVKCKRATNEIIQALSPGNIIEDKPLKENQYCDVFKLKAKIDGKEAVVKIIENGMVDQEQIEEEVTALQTNGQLLGWGHTPDQKLYYLVMEYMGVPLEETPFKEDHERITKLKTAAINRYKLHYGLTHDDYEENESNWTYRQVNGVWQAELIDWEFYFVDEDHHAYRPINPKTAINLDPNCIFVPPNMAHHL